MLCDRYEAANNVGGERKYLIWKLLHRKSLITDHILYNKKRPPYTLQGERLVYALQNRYFPFLHNAYRK